MKLKKFIYKLKWGFEVNHNLINEGKVFINGKVKTDKEYELLENDLIKINDIEIPYRSIINIVLYKPKNYLSARKDKIHKCVIELLPRPYSYYNFHLAGRLDLDTEGMLILTTSTRFANQIANPLFHVKKQYEVLLNKDITDVDLLRLKEPMILRDDNFEKYISKIISYKRLAKNKIMIELAMGKYHQVKEICKYIGYEVINLKRVKISNLTLKNLKSKEFYEFRKEDICIV